MSTNRMIPWNFANIYTVLVLILGAIGVIVSGFDCPRNDVGECIDGTYPNVYNCSTYWSCSDCEAWLQHCPSPLEYSEEVEACVSPEDSNCEGTSFVL